MCTWKNKSKINYKIIYSKINYKIIYFKNLPSNLWATIDRFGLIHLIKWVPVDDNLDISSVSWERNLLLTDTKLNFPAVFGGGILRNPLLLLLTTSLFTNNDFSKLMYIKSIHNLNIKKLDE